VVNGRTVVLVVVGIVIAGVAVDKLWVVGEGDIVVAVEVVGGIVEVVTGHLGVDVVGTLVEVVVQKSPRAWKPCGHRQLRPGCRRAKNGS